ncbi:hypothetical protein TNCT_240591 [Trichonephila clavata]|uniref:Uncharacterized protein n=1 Tax=Trichonephila clavata TaxID=2740835 RepID=A0A8X6K8I2_TRICU|nr:hypothetical protein TNCT_240591 [Trichonephila clavata]
MYSRLQQISWDDAPNIVYHKTGELEIMENGDAPLAVLHDTLPPEKAGVRRDCTFLTVTLLSERFSISKG